MRTTIKLITVVAAIVLGLAACGNHDDDDDTSFSSSSSTSNKHNDADVAFAQEMTPHHAQAIVMANVARSRAKDPALRQLAADIQAAQGREIEQMSQWLRAWGEEVPSTDMGMDGTGSMMDDRMPGSRFDRMWLQMMVRHHEGAIELARNEQQTGLNADAIELARRIASAQAAEILLMRSMLRS